MTKADAARGDGDWVEAVLAEMTVDEKIGQLNMNTLGSEIVTGPGAARADLATLREGRVGSILNVVGRERIDAAQKIAVAESRLGIPILFCLDVIHGYRTAFPVPIAEAGAFSPDLWRRTAAAAAAEGRADGIMLTFAPMVDVARDPRWGRIVEGPGEDGWLAARMAAAKVAGFQGDDAGAAGAMAATAKHFVAYGAANAGRDYASADISARQLHEVYLPAFKAAVEADVAAIMPAFHDLAGVPMSAHRELMTDLVREVWGFQGVYISDYGGVRELIAHGIAADPAEAAGRALRAGMDIDMMSGAFAEGLRPALERGLITMGEIDAAVRRVLRLKARLGLRPRQLVATDPTSRVTHSELRALAREAAEASITLLSNTGGVLPLKPGGGPIALVGPFVDDPDQLLGPWAGLSQGDAGASLATGLREAFPERLLMVEPVMAPLSEGGPEDEAAIAAAVAAVADAEVILVAVGEPRERSAEAASRAFPGFWGAQARLVEAMLATGKPVVLLIVAGRPIIETALIERAAATVMLWYPGSEAGAAVGRLLSGAVSPSGRLPVSWPRAVGQIPVFFGERPTGRPFGVDPTFCTRYVDVPNEPLFPFGHGLTYGRFLYGEPRLSAPEMEPGGVLRVEVDIRNDGPAAATETVFLFVRDHVASVARPVLELRGFERISLDPGQTDVVRFRLTEADLAFWQGGDRFIAEPGAFDVLVGPSADHGRLRSVPFRLQAGTQS